MRRRRWVIALLWPWLMVGCAGGSTGPTPDPTSVIIPSAAPSLSNAPRPKKVILMIGDGLGFSTLDLATSGLTGKTAFQPQGQWPKVSVSGGATGTILDQFPVALAATTFPAGGSYVGDAGWRTPNRFRPGATDSAAAATALATGTKTLPGRLGIGPNGEKLPNVVESAARATGIVSSVPFSHATPAGFVGHSAERNSYLEIARQVIDSQVDVVFSPGHPDFDNAGERRASPSYGFIGEPDYRRLVTGQTKFQFLTGAQEFRALAAGSPEAGQLRPRFGLVERGSIATAAPSLAELSLAALNTLSADPSGLFLMIEGGEIDWAAHDNKVAETVAATSRFLTAVEAVSGWVEKHSSWAETLLIVTADHETGFIVGPGTGEARGWRPIGGPKGEVPKVTWLSTGHTNQLVPVFARGAWAEQLRAAATATDPVRGPYLDNTDIGRLLLDATR